MLTNSDMMVGEIAETLHFEDNALFNPFLQEIWAPPGRASALLYAGGEYFATKRYFFSKLYFLITQIAGSVSPALLIPCIILAGR